ncbi:beta-glucanase (GH16 family) [Jatrophihabitans sp. GAS493]|uniref:glycoside hydrolase family 16 protein n=1 Tax=Jatrophihabitans sp. GAS493 TaxID=1907575 RepID=UPI000BB7A990|nr:glycoside hydrolase family 16 protein [Jatrophihabitans sp. GAS493]SOD71573.1 beta-glucanase (GH16 family) [Jatrophihabitans sp. GAS493]
MSISSKYPSTRARKTLLLAAIPISLLALVPLASNAASAATVTTTATATPTPTPVPSISSNVAGRKLVVSDEFSGTAGTAPSSYIWQAIQGGGGWGNNELETYTNRASNVSLDGKGDVAITARKETYTGKDGITRNYTSARLLSNVSVKYGYIEARMFVPQGQGLWPAFWTLGSDIYPKGYPYSGEIDIMEALNKMPTVFGTLHGPDSVHQSVYGVGPKTSPAGGLAGAWHTYGIDWTSTAITWFIDGKSYGSITKATMPAGAVWEFDKPHLMQLNLAVGGNWPGSPDATTPAVSTMLVDYVRVYSSTTSGVTPAIGYTKINLG